MAISSQVLLTILNAIAPIFILVLLGMLLMRMRLLNETFIDTGSRLVFQLAMPVMLFLATAKTPFNKTLNPLQVYYLIGATILAFLCVWAISALFIRKGADLGAFVQGAFRGNFAVIGLALIINLYGDEGLAQSSVLIAVIIPLYNILAVLCLSFTQQQRLSLKKLVKAVLLNPLIVAVALGVPFALFQWSLPAIVTHTGSYIADITMPLALLCIGGTLNLAALRRTSGLALLSALLKLVLLPVTMIYGAWLVGLRGMPLALLLIVFASPTALASFIMAKGMRANAELAGAIILVSTLLSPITLTIGLYLIHILAI